MDILLENIPIKPLCNMVLEYCYYSRPFLNELNDATDNIKQKIEYYTTYMVYKDVGCSDKLYIKRVYQHFDIDSGFLDHSHRNKLRLLDRENERREYLELKPNRYLFGLSSCSATNSCYIGY